MSPTQRYLRLAPDRKAPLLAATTRESAAHGEGAASPASISEAAGLSQGSPYDDLVDRPDPFAEALALQPGPSAGVCLGIGTAVDAWMATHLESLPPQELLALNAKTLEMFRLVSLPPGAEEER